MTGREFWRVDVFSEDLQRWCEWATWLDQTTAYAERDFAHSECGYERVRVRRQQPDRLEVSP